MKARFYYDPGHPMRYFEGEVSSPPPARTKVRHPDGTEHDHVLGDASSVVVSKGQPIALYKLANDDNPHK